MEFVVMAAGRGTRMKSRTAKVLHQIAGRPLLYYPVRAAFEFGATRVIVVCSDESCSSIQQQLDGLFGAGRAVCRVQSVPRGTGDAARVGLEACESDKVGILCGDTPLVTAEVLRELDAALGNERAVLAFLSCVVEQPQGYGRVLRNEQSKVIEIREQRDLRSAAERAVREVNAGIYMGDRDALAGALARIKPNNDQGEYYLTDAVADLAASATVIAKEGDSELLVGVNDRVQLVEAESAMFSRIARRHALAGVTVQPGALIDDAVTIGADTMVATGVCLRGNTNIGDGNFIDIGCVIVDSRIGDRNVIESHSVIEKSVVGSGTKLGPFAHLRPDSIIEDEAHIGNFVETKKTIVRKGAKANHLSYLGDGDVGEKSNIGAGTIFCNYDGYQKHRTVIGPRVFIGSDSQLVAPVTIGAGAYVATGTTVTSDVPEDALAIGRVRQENKPGYAAQLKVKLAAAAGKKP
jgi:bifunctional UDP-N-acetylglucosamine pyrophosphorylase/glucosamine-1-phosphate N-acetyltransferase